MFLILTALQGHALHDNEAGKAAGGWAGKSMGEEKGMMDAGKEV
jgi:hypothetical protein